MIQASICKSDNSTFYKDELPFWQTPGEQTDSLQVTDGPPVSSLCSPDSTSWMCTEPYYYLQYRDEKTGVVYYLVPSPNNATVVLSATIVPGISAPSKYMWHMSLNSASDLTYTIKTVDNLYLHNKNNTLYLDTNPGQAFSLPLSSTLKTDTSLQWQWDQTVAVLESIAIPTNPIFNNYVNEVQLNIAKTTGFNPTEFNVKSPQFYNSDDFIHVSRQSLLTKEMGTFKIKNHDLSYTLQPSTQTGYIDDTTQVIWKYGDESDGYPWRHTIGGHVATLIGGQEYYLSWSPGKTSWQLTPQPILGMTLTVGDDDVFIGGMSIRIGELIAVSNKQLAGSVQIPVLAYTAVTSNWADNSKINQTYTWSTSASSDDASIAKQICGNQVSSCNVRNPQTWASNNWKTAEDVVNQVSSYSPTENISVNMPLSTYAANKVIGNLGKMQTQALGLSDAIEVSPHANYYQKPHYPVGAEILGIQQVTVGYCDDGLNGDVVDVDSDTKLNWTLVEHNPSTNKPSNLRSFQIALTASSSNFIPVYSKSYGNQEYYLYVNNIDDASTVYYIIAGDVESNYSWMVTTDQTKATRFKWDQAYRTFGILESVANSLSVYYRSPIKNNYQNFPMCSNGSEACQGSPLKMLPLYSNLKDANSYLVHNIEGHKSLLMSDPYLTKTNTLRFYPSYKNNFNYTAPEGLPDCTEDQLAISNTLPVGTKLPKSILSVKPSEVYCKVPDSITTTKIPLTWAKTYASTNTNGPKQINRLGNGSYVYGQMIQLQNIGTPYENLNVETLPANVGNNMSLKYPIPESNIATGIRIPVPYNGNYRIDINVAFNYKRVDSVAKTLNSTMHLYLNENKGKVLAKTTQSKALQNSVGVSSVYNFQSSWTGPLVTTDNVYLSVAASLHDTNGNPTPFSCTNLSDCEFQSLSWNTSSGDKVLDTTYVTISKLN